MDCHALLIKVSQYNMVQTGIYQDETFPFVYKLICTRMSQVKYILVHKSTSPVDLVYTLLGRAGSRESSWPLHGFGGPCTVSNSRLPDCASPTVGSRI